MDYETKILLNRLVDEVEKLNSPDWWVIGITVVNALIVAWLAWRQYQLQKQQVKFQEYEMYKELYLFVKDIYDVSNSFLSDICRIFSDKFYKDNELDSLKNIANNLNELGNGNIVVQRLGDIHRGKRTWDKELHLFK